MKTSIKDKRGIRIQTRFIVSALFLLLQIAFLLMVIYRVSEHYIVLYNMSQIIAAFTVIYIINRRGNPSYKIAWIIFILIFPIFGISVFLLWGGGRVMPYLKKRMQACEEHYNSLLADDGKAKNRLEYDDYSHFRQAQYLSGEADAKLYENTSVEYLSPGEKFFPRFLQELENAEKYIFIEFFIIAEGKMWDAVSEILRRKAKSGVEVRVLFDDFGSIKRQRKDFISRLKKDGIKVAVFNKIGPSMNIFMNNRNHRKIVVIDGKVAVTGGLNLADEYINEIERFGYWLDSAVILKGPAANSFLAMFCSTWEFTTRERIDMKPLLGEYTAESNGFVMPYCDGPLNDVNPAEGLCMQMLSSANKYVYIASPYLIIDSTMITALRLAAKSGIDVRIVTPHIPDKWYVHPVTQYSYLELLEAGVRIYEYTPGFIHSKLFVSDDRIATVGTVNMDYRSFILHFECGVWISDFASVGEIKADYDNILSQSREIKLDEWKRQPWHLRLKRAILHLFAPFM